MEDYSGDKDFSSNISSKIIVQKQSSIIYFIPRDIFVPKPFWEYLKVLHSHDPNLILPHKICLRNTSFLLFESILWIS